MPVTHDALDMQDAELARSVGCAILFRPVVDCRAPRYVLAQSLECRVLALNRDLVWSLDNDRDLHAPLAGTDDGLLDVRDRIDGIAHQQDSALRGVQNLQDGLLRVPEGDLLAAWSGPDYLDRLVCLS